jgi:hypothetical protein
MPNFDMGLYFIDLKDTDNKQEYKLDFDKINQNENERNKQWILMGKRKDRMPRVKAIMDYEYVVRPFISPDGRTLVITAAYNVYFIDPITMSLFLSVACERSVYCKMTDTHVFVKHTNGNWEFEWTVISFKDT